MKMWIIKHWIKRKKFMICHPIYFIASKVDENIHKVNYHVGENAYRYFRKNFVHCRKDRKDVFKAGVSHYKDKIQSKFKRWLIFRDLLRDDRGIMFSEFIQSIWNDIAHFIYLWFGRDEE